MVGAWQTLLVGGTEGELLTGVDSRDPIMLGSLFEFRGCFCDGSEAGNALAVALRAGPVPRSYVCRPFAASDDYYGWHLLENKYASNTVLVRLAGLPGDLLTKKVSKEEVEMTAVFRVIALPGEVVDIGEVEWVPDKDRIKIVRDIGFTQEMLARAPVNKPEVR
jgi:hypothetical protein